ncbi:arginine-glutamic acid dipeptide repeats protein-like [Pollicipes pollicipes]|uniref:arginine-glutamic acid dipeptide repeats protein-like n=1 Tax=Pollicipes pollicipes TaxID=41117 RepID=UPI001884DF51|nr:arginine-glutamic acid dipeptide repeats protein-like [Pollicipes pollicipes]
MVSLDQDGEQCGKTEKGGGAERGDDEEAMRGDLKAEPSPAVGAEAGRPAAAEADADAAPPQPEYDDFAMPVAGKSRLVRGRGWRGADGEYVRYKCFDDDTEYLPGDSVYIESQQKDQPYFICTIQDFRRSKRDTLMVNIKWFYRVCELPENVYQLLVQDRTTEHDSGLAVQDPAVKHRELFISDATDTFPVAVLRGPCKVIHYSDVRKVREYAPATDTFFYVLTYNPETRRLASTQGEIRVGPSHQAKLPEYRGSPHAGIPPRPTGAEEERLWAPGRAADSDLLMFLRAARSMAAFAGMCDGGSTDEGCAAASRDDTTQNALDVLHHSGYDQGAALQALVKSPVPVGVHQRWTDEETKKFVKGLRQYGKNFFRIRKELLVHKETSELVEFYYLWKKTPGAQGNRPRNIARHRRANGIRRIKNRKGANKTHKDDPAAIGCDLSSASEAENDDSDDSDSNLRDLSGYHCRHCFTTSSKDWHHAGKEHALLCTGCRLYFKKYGQLPDVKEPREPPFALQPAREEAGRMRTRTRAKELTRGHRPKRTSSSRANTPSDAGRQSPGGGSSCSASSSSDKSRASSQPQRTASQAAKRPGSRLDAADVKPDKKKKRANYTSGDDSLSDSASDAEAGTDAPDADLPSSETSSPSLDEQQAELDEPPRPQNLTVKQEPRSDSEEPPRPAPPPLTAVKAEPRTETALTSLALTTAAPAERPAMPVYPHHMYGYQYPYPYPYGGYPVRPAAGAPGETLDLRKSESRETTVASNAVSVVTRTATSHATSSSATLAPTERASPQASASLSLSSTVTSTRRPPSRPSRPTRRRRRAAVLRLARPPSPEPKLEDSECHRSQSAIFLRHWNRGEASSCARTDMTFKPVPDSKLARRREERLRKQSERQERERADRDRDRQQQQRKEGAEKREKGSPRTQGGAGAGAGASGSGGGGGAEHDRLPVRPSESGLPRLSDYGRPLSVISPGVAPYSSGGFLPPHMDPMYAMAPGLPPGVYPRDRMEMEMLERREREIRELRERDLNERLKEEMFKSRPLDPHWLEMQRRQMVPGVFLPPGVMYPPPISWRRWVLLAASDQWSLRRVG